MNKRKFRILDDPVLVTPDEIFDYFNDVRGFNSGSTVIY